MAVLIPNEAFYTAYQVVGNSEHRRYSNDKDDAIVVVGQISKERIALQT